MDLMPIPFIFIQERVCLSWRDALWGYERNMLSWSGIVDLAKAMKFSTTDMCVVELSYLDKSTTYKIGDLLREIAATEIEPADSISIKKWFFLTLAWTFENKSRIDDPLGEVEKIYADFDYPVEIENFVRYMPAVNSNDISLGGIEESEGRVQPIDATDQLFINWEKYLDMAGSELR